MKHLFVTGTDTGVGKTRFSSLLLAALRQNGRRVAGWKPVCCGDREDAEALLSAGDPSLTLDEINPLWLRVPAAPLTAAIIENRPIDPARLRESGEELAGRFDHVIAEGAGGWHVPVTTQWQLSDLAAELGWPVVIVVGNRLGALNHARLTWEAVRVRGLLCLGFVVNHLSDSCDPASLTNAGVLASLEIAPVLGEIPFGAKTLPTGLLEKLAGAVPDVPEPVIKQFAKIFDDSPRELV